MSPIYVIAAIVIIGGLSAWLIFEVIGLVKAAKKRAKQNREKAAKESSEITDKDENKN